jgi:hypothetical protein
VICSSVSKEIMLQPLILSGTSTTTANKQVWCIVLQVGQITTITAGRLKGSLFLF